MSKFPQYCGLTLLILTVILFQPFAYGLPSANSEAFYAGSLWFTEYTGIQLWKFFLVPFSIVLGILALSFRRNIWYAIVGITLSFALLLYSAILPYLMPVELTEMLAGYDYLLALAGVFVLLNISNAFQTFKNDARTKKKSMNNDILDDL